MEGREGARVVTQRHLAEEEASPSASVPEEPKGPPTSVAGGEPAVPSNQGILARQRRWFRERARFEARPPEDEGPK